MELKIKQQNKTVDMEIGTRNLQLWQLTTTMFRMNSVIKNPTSTARPYSKTACTKQLSFVQKPPVGNNGLSEEQPLPRTGFCLLSSAMWPTKSAWSSTKPVVHNSWFLYKIQPLPIGTKNCAPNQTIPHKHQSCDGAAKKGSHLEKKI